MKKREETGIIKMTWSSKMVHKVRKQFNTAAVSHVNHYYLQGPNLLIKDTLLPKTKLKIYLLL